MSTKLERFDWSEILRRRLDMPGEGGPKDLSPEVVGCVVLENDRPEWPYLSGERLGGFAITQPLNAALVSTVRVRNPVGSGVILVLEDSVISVNLTGEVAFRISNLTADLATVGITAVRDRRFGDQQLAAIASRDNAAAGGGRGMWHHFCLANTPYPIPGGFVLPPGTNAEWTTIAVNTGLYVSGRIRERRLGSFEL